MTKIRLSVGERAENIEKRFDYISSSSVYEIFPDSFIKDFTNHNNFTDFCQAIGCDLTSQDSLDKLQDTNEFDSAIRLNSDFDSWQDMVETAYQKIIDKK